MKTAREWRSERMAKVWSSTAKPIPADATSLLSEGFIGDIQRDAAVSWLERAAKKRCWRCAADWHQKDDLRAFHKVNEYWRHRVTGGEILCESSCIHDLILEASE